MRVPLSVFAAMIPLFLPNVPQQQKPISRQPEGYTLRANAKLVVLDVVVTDKNGNPVTGLKKEDFEVQEDKQVQRIYSFEAPAAHALPPSVVIHSTEELDRLAPNAAATVLVLDEFSAKFEDMTYARISIEKYLKAQPHLLAQPTMLVAVNVNHMVVLQDYTQNKDAVLTSLRRYTPDILTITSTGSKSWLSDEINAGYRALAQVAQATMGHPGHKNVIWVGLGLPHFTTGMKISPDDVGVSHNEALRLHTALQKVINLLQVARVTLYTIDPRGVGLFHNPFDGVASFAEVAVATGGKPIYNRNDVEVAIDSTMQRGNEFYTLSYIPTSNSDAKGDVRRIRLLMKNPALQATTRLGYYPEPATAPQQIATANNAGSMASKGLIDETLANTTLVYDGIPLTLARMGTQGLVAVRMQAAALPWVDHGPDRARTAALQVSCVSFDKKENMLLHEGANTEVSSPAAPSQASQNGNIEFSLKCDTDPRAVRLRVVVQTPDTGKIGAANLDLTAK